MNFFLVFTPLHFFISCAIASNNKERNCLIFIELKDGHKDYYINVLNHWKNNPFENVYFIDRVKFINPVHKIRIRKRIFKRFRNICYTKQPNKIYSADDRAVIPQYIMHCCKQVKVSPTTGYYIDDGLSSYIATASKTNPIANAFNSLVRKISYGSWYRAIRKNGSSTWTDCIIVAFPKHLQAHLKTKKCITLNPSLFHTDSMLDLSHTILSQYPALRSLLTTIDLVITLPIQADMNSINAYKYSLYSMLEKISQHKKIAIKYHPETKGIDKLTLQEKFNINLIPDNIPFEAILPLLSDKIIVLGDISSTLMMTKLLKPSATIYAFKMNNSRYYRNFSHFLKLINIPSLNIAEIAYKIKPND